MTLHNPAGYYGLQLPAAIEEAIEALDYEQTVILAHSLTYNLGDGSEERFYSFIRFTPSSFDDAIDKLPTSDKIALLRWLSEILFFKHTK